MIEHLGYEDIQMKGHPPVVYTTVVLTDRGRGKSWATLKIFVLHPKLEAFFWTNIL